MRSLAARSCRSPAHKSGQPLAMACLLLAGCAGPMPLLTAETPTRPATVKAEPLTYSAAPAATPNAPPPAQIETRLIVLHVQAPRSARLQVSGVWNQVREDVLDSATAERLNNNGLRVGLGRTERWDAVKAIFDASPNSRVHELPPLRGIPGLPLALDLDRAPRDQTIFYLEQDGILSGDTWPASQKVLRVSFDLDLQERDRVQLAIVPEIRQELPPAVTYTREEGWSGGPRREGRAYGSAAFVVPLDANEFILLAPGEKADVFGMVGGAFLTDRVAGEPYDSYVFIRAEVNRVQQSR